MVHVTYGDERATVFHQGGIGFARRVRGVGWIVCDRPSRLIVRLALAVRREAFPALEDIGIADVVDTEDAGSMPEQTQNNCRNSEGC